MTVKRTLSAKRWLYVLIGPLASIVVFVVTYFVLNKFENQIPENAVPALLLSVLTMMIVHSVKSHGEVEKNSENSNNMIEAIRNYLHVIPLGHPVTALSYIESKIENIKFASNTSFNTEDEIEYSTDKFYKTEQYSKFYSRLCNAIEGGSITWRELGDSDATQRFYAHKSKIKNNQASHYRFRVLEQMLVPQINFIILEYQDCSSCEVLFNWDYTTHGEEPTVLLSRDEKIVRMFTAHFDNLWKKGTTPHE